MSGLKNPFRTEKPHSSITDWVEILTGPNIEEEAYDGIPELVDSINLQPGGPLEASRAIRKKLKHGNAHQQYRALVLLKALVENCGTKFLVAFSDGTLTDALRLIGSDVTVNKRVKKKLLLVLSSWKEQYAGEPSMALIAGLYKQCRVAEKREQHLYDMVGLDHEEEKRAARKREAKEERKKAKEKARSEEEARRRNRNQPKRAPFNFEKDKPKVLECISEASQASSNLINAITLVNTEKEKLEDNSRVQNCLIVAKETRKNVVRYIRLVENEELIGTLIETNERIMNALEMYDQITAAGSDAGNDAKTAGITDQLATTTISEGEVARLQQKQRAAIEAHNTGSQYESSPSPEPISSNIHPDLEDLDFGASSSKLPPPMRPKRFSDDDDEVEYIEKRGSLSEYSDYESSDEETHKSRAGPSTHQRKKSYVTVSDNESVGFAESRVGLTQEDPFADPFADSNATGVRN